MEIDIEANGRQFEAGRSSTGRRGNGLENRRKRMENLCVFFSSRRRHTEYIGDWSSDVCSSDLYRSHELKLQSRFARRVRQRLHAPVILIAAAIEDYALDALFLGPL